MKPFLQKFFAVLAFGALVLALIVVMGIWRINQWVSELGVQSLDYRIENISFGSATLSRLVFDYRTEKIHHKINTQDVSLQWEWPSIFKPRLVSVDIAHLQWKMLRDNNHSAASSTAPAMPDDWSVPDVVPDSIIIRNSHLLLPCPAGECSLAANLDMQREGGKVKLNAEISPGTEIHQQHLKLTGEYHVNQGLPAVVLQLNAGEEIQANLQTKLIHAESLSWAGQINAAARYPAAWLRDALADWHITVANQWAQTVTQPMNARAEWQLDVDALMNSNNLPWHKTLNGFAHLNLDVASPIAVQDIGEFSGSVVLHIKANNGALEQYEISTDVTVTEPVVPAAAQALGVGLTHIHVQANSQPDDVSLTTLPVRLSIKTEGELTADVNLNASVDVISKTFHLPKISIDAQVNQIQLTPDIQFNNLDISWRGAAEWEGNQFVIRGESPTHLHGDLHAEAWSVSARGIKLAIDQVAASIKLDDVITNNAGWDNAALDWRTTEIDGAVALSVAQLQHPQLHTKPWQWRGSLQGNWVNFSMGGDVIVNNALVVSHKVKRTPGELIVDWQLRDSFLLAGNPFADLVKAWPSLLSLAQGKVGGSGRVVADINKNNVKNAQANLVISEISGVYDTTLFQGVTTTLAMAASPRSFTVTANELRVKQINKGFVFGPLKAGGVYESDWQNPTSGKFSLQHFNADVIGGNVTTPPQVFDLAREKQSLVLTLENIDLGMLLQQHPSAELSGSGRISGTVPIEITAKGVSVPKGTLAARPPGGQLQFHSERAEALARSQPGMKLITDALEDFHYTVLASEVNYDEDGKLLLALRLEGKNPALEKGRPVHFNINLEEDLPAMIASIQLSNQISDVVKKRLQEHLQKRSNR